MGKKDRVIVRSERTCGGPRARHGAGPKLAPPRGVPPRRKRQRKNLHLCRVWRFWEPAMYGGRLRSAVRIPLRWWACKRQTHYWLPAGTPSVRQKYRLYHEHRRGLCHRCRSHTRIL